MSIGMPRALIVAALGVLPPFLIGASAHEIGYALELRTAQIGLAAAACFATAGVLSRRAGRWVQRHGANSGLVMGATCSGLAFVGIATSIHYATLVSWLCLAGIGNAFAQPGANMAITQSVSASRLGLALGIKQSSIPLATMVAGIVVPMMVLPMGWRPTFLLFGAGSVVVAGYSVFQVLRPRAGADVKEAVSPAGGKRELSLVLLAIGAGIATGASGALGIFFVDAGVRSGLTIHEASALLAFCSLLVLSVRVLLGWAADVVVGFDTLKVMSLLLVFGALGYVFLADGLPRTYVVGGILAYGAGWTWAGLAHLTAIRDGSGEVAASTGVLQVGISLGGAAGPVLVGHLAERGSFAVAWWFAGVALLLSGAMVFMAGCRSWRGAPGATGQGRDQAKPDELDGGAR